MTKKPTKILTALFTSLSLAASGAFAVFGTQSDGVLSGINDVANVVISVVVPANLNFTLDPLELMSEDGSQIAPEDYFFINKTGAPVKVSLEIQAELAESASLVDDPAELDKDDDHVTDKKMFFGILGADALDAGDLSFEKAVDHSAKGVYDFAKDTLIPFNASDRKSSVAFVLDQATSSSPDTLEPDTLAAGDKSVGAFRFYGELNTYAEWADGDVKVSGTYNITPLRGSTYDRYLEDGGFTEGGWGTQLAADYVPDITVPEDAAAGLTEPVPSNTQQPVNEPAGEASLTGAEASETETNFN